MPSQFAAQAVPLGHVFANVHTIKTPTYQRSYAWDEDDAGKLIEDVAAALDGEDGAEGEEYFLGTMLFMEVERWTKRALPFSRQRQPSFLLEVVDGLQRLTTLTILFCIMRDLDVAEGIKPSERVLTAIGTGPEAVQRRLALREPDEAFFQMHVRRAGATGTSRPDAALSPAERNIIDVRDRLFQTMQDLESAQRRRLTDFLLDKCQVVMVSTSGIDRAHRIFTVLNARGKPLEHNDILKADLLGGVPPAALARATAVWDQAESLLGEEFDSLFGHIRVLHGRPPTKVISGIRAIAAETGGSLAFIDRVVQPAAAILDDINHARHSGSPYSPAISASLTYLGWLTGNRDWVPPVIQWWLGRGRDPAELAWFLGALDRLAYGLRILGLAAKRRGGRFSAVAQAIRSGKDLQAQGSPLSLTRDEVRTIHHNLRDLHARSAPMSKLVLLRLNDHIAGSPQGVAFENLSVEHLLPRKPGLNSPWREVFPDPAERGLCTESLGNLVLVTKAQNDKAGNLDFARKKEVLFKGGGLMLPINATVQQQREWTPRQIKEREAELLGHLDQLWKIGPAPARGGSVPPPVSTPQQQRRPPRAAAGG